MSTSELQDQIFDDFKRFTSLFHLHDDADYDQELRQKYRIGNQERKFRQDQKPEKREKRARLTAITTFFLNRIKERALESQSMRKLVDPSIINSSTRGIPSMLGEREMHMLDEFDKVDVSIENLYQ